MTPSKAVGPVAKAVQSGDRRQALEAVRNKLAHEIDLVGDGRPGTASAPDGSSA